MINPSHDVSPLHVCAAPLNPTVGDVWGNGTNSKTVIDKAEQVGGGVLLTPELAIWGYPPGALLVGDEFF